MTAEKRIWLGYAILAIAMIVGIWAFTTRSDRNLRNEINALGKNGCIAGIKTYNKFNDSINSQIITQEQALILNAESNQPKRADINRQAIKRLKKDLIVPPTIEQCSKPILK